MLGWQNPAALWTLSVIAVPIVVHLLRTYHAKRIAFPTLRFVQPSRTAAVRMRLPSDVLLMLIRMAIVAAAAAGLARPILLTNSRLSAWDARIARAVVIDRSESMRARNSTGMAPETAAAEAAEAEMRTATYASRFTATDIEDGLVRASRWLDAQPPSRREVVVISDLQRGALDESFVNAVGRGAGVRFIRIGAIESRASFEGLPLLGVPGTGGRAQRIETTPDSTSVEMESQPAVNVPGLRIMAAPGSEAKVARLLRAVATAGAYRGSADQPIAVRLSGAPREQPGSIVALKPGWMLRAALRLRESGALAASAAELRPLQTAERSSQEPWATLVRGASGQPLVRAAATQASELVVDVVAPPDDIFAAIVTQAVLNARADPATYAEREIARLDDAAIAAMTRQAEPVERDAWRTAETTDARWCWVGALLLLGIEQWLRARGVRRPSEEVTRAAA